LRGDSCVAKKKRDITAARLTSPGGTSGRLAAPYRDVRPEPESFAGVSLSLLGKLLRQSATEALAHGFKGIGAEPIAGFSRPRPKCWRRRTFNFQDVTPRQAPTHGLGREEVQNSQELYRGRPGASLPHAFCPCAFLRPPASLPSPCPPLSEPAARQHDRTPRKRPARFTDEVFERNPDRLRQPLCNIESCGALATLEQPHVVAVDAGGLGEAFLRDLMRASMPPDNRPKRSGKLCTRHALARLLQSRAKSSTQNTVQTGYWAKPPRALGEQTLAAAYAQRRKKTKGMPVMTVSRPTQNTKLHLARAQLSHRHWQKGSDRKRGGARAALWRESVWRVFSLTNSSDRHTQWFT